MASQNPPAVRHNRPEPGMQPDSAAQASNVLSNSETQGVQGGCATADAESACVVPFDFGGDEVVQKAAKYACELVKEWRAKLEPLGVKVILGGSLVSGLALPADVHDMDVRFLYDGERRKLIPKIEEVTGLSFRKTITMAEGEGAPGWDAHLIEGKITWADVTFDVEGSLRNTSYTCWAQFYPQVMSFQELADARQRKIELRINKKAYKEFKDALLQTIKQRARERGLID